MFDLIADTSNWNMAPKYRRRRAVVFTIAIGLLLFGISQIAGNLWWVGDGYCWGPVTECFEEFGK